MTTKNPMVYLNQTQKLAIKTAIERLKYIKGFETTCEVLAQLVIRSEK